jgi:hypothetical protein
MKTVQINLYQFNELESDAQKVAIADAIDINVNFNWWQYIYEDARTIGLKITGFDIGTYNYCNGEFQEDALFTAGKILEQHGDQTATYQRADKFIVNRDELVETWEKDANGDFEEVEGLDTVLDNMEAAFLKELLNDYLRMLDKEYDYLTSEVAIKDTILNNEFWFTTDGKIANYQDSKIN